MATPEALMQPDLKDQARWFASLAARRILVLAGIGMILAGMIFGDIFAIFILHQNASRVGGSLSAAANAAITGDSVGVGAGFANVGEFLENRGTKVDTHVHLIGFGYLALMLAIVQPWVSLSELARRRLACIFVFGGVLLPVGVFLIHYVGLAYSPLQAIGWASIFADAGGLVVMIATAGYLIGLARYLTKKDRPLVSDPLLSTCVAARPALLAGGLFLVLLGFLHGAWYASSELYAHETADYRILAQMASSAATQDSGRLRRTLLDYGQLQGDKAVNIAAHAHFVEFGLLAMMLAFFQPYVKFKESWRRRWAGVMLVGSVLLPICVLLEIKFGVIAGGLADTGGLLVIIACMAMWVGILRYTGSLDATRGEPA